MLMYADRGLEDYGARIRRPMDLGTVLNNLEDGKYCNPHAFRLDVIQVCFRNKALGTRHEAGSRPNYIAYIAILMPSV